MAYAGHAEHSASKAAFEAGDGSGGNLVAPADQPQYDPSDFENEPGAAARAKGYPRHDGQSTSVGGPR